MLLFVIAIDCEICWSIRCAATLVTIAYGSIYRILPAPAPDRMIINNVHSHFIHELSHLPPNLKCETAVIDEIRPLLFQEVLTPLID